MEQTPLAQLQSLKYPNPANPDSDNYANHGENLTIAPNRCSRRCEACYDSGDVFDGRGATALWEC